MNWKMKILKSKINLLLLVIIFFSCNNEKAKTSRVDELPYYNEATFTPIWLGKDKTRAENLHEVAPFKLTNQLGETITEKTFEGKIYVTDFFFTSCPGICPKMTANMEIIQEEFLKESDVLLLSHSVTPERDSVPILKEYAENKGIISNKWHLATGSQEEIYRLGRHEYFVEEDLGITKDVDEFLHTENFVLVDKDRHIRGIYNGLSKSSVNQLIADIKTLRREL